jgi:hypothetical protein
MSAQRYRIKLALLTLVVADANLGCVFVSKATETYTNTLWYSSDVHSTVYYTSLLRTITWLLQGIVRHFRVYHSCYAIAVHSLVY